MSTPLSASQKKNLRTLGHELKPLVQLGAKGLTESVMLEIERALSDHELIKVRLAGQGPDDRKVLITKIEEELAATAVQSIGHMVLLFRKNPDANPKLSNLKSF
jgi:RNA-binding protein